jgi:chemotaxis protein MotB
MEGKSRVLPVIFGLLFLASAAGWLAFYALSYRPLADRSNDLLEQITQLQTQIATLELQEQTLTETDIALGQNSEILDLGEVFFHSGYSYLTPQALRQLDEISLRLESSPEARVQIVGHADTTPIGSKLQDKYPSNWELSVERSMTTAHYLLEKSDFSFSQFVIIGLSHEEPKTPNDSPEGRSQNRRAEIRIVQ